MCDERAIASARWLGRAAAGTCVIRGGQMAKKPPKKKKKKKK
jgi:hypothetical protein